jgi:hypothetical protein
MEVTFLRMRKKEKEAIPNIYTKKKLLSFPIKVINNNNNKKKTKPLVECNCWVCKILDSSTTSANNNETDTTTTTATKRYEPYNIVSESGDSIFYNPSLLSNINNDEFKGQIYVSETAIEEVVNRIIDQKRLGPSLNNIKNGN